MKFQYLLSMPMALLFSGRALGSHTRPYQSTTTSTAEPTTTTYTTETVTITQTSVVFETKTRAMPCPAYQTGVLNFDDLTTSGVSPMELIYDDFSFDGSAGWQYYTSNAFPVGSPERRGVYSAPNALLSRSSGLVAFGSKDRHFSFDLTSVAFFPFTPEGSTNDTLLIQVEILGADDSTQSLFFEHPNGAINGSLVPVIISGDDLSEFVDLVEVAVAVWQTYDEETGEGNPGEFVLDNIEYVKRRCGSY